MATRINDRWLWLGLGFFAFFAVKGIGYGLREVVRLTEVRNQAVPPRRVSQETEDYDHIKLHSLKTLATCSNVEIRKAATRILCDRFVHSPEARGALMQDLRGSDEEQRECAIRAVRLVDLHTGGSDWRRYNPVHHPLIPLAPHPQSFDERDWGSPDSPGVRSRRQDEGPEEMAARRRRREAMVLNEGDRPVSQHDIIQQGAANRIADEEVRRTERALADLVELALDPSLLEDSILPRAS